MKKAPALLFFSSLSLSACLLAEERPRISTVVGQSAYRVSAYPCIATLSDGSLICAFSAADPAVPGKLIVARVVSRDNGETWSKPQTLIHTPNQDDYDPNVIVIGSRVIVTSTTVPKGDDLSTSRTIAVRSDDDGATWSKPYEIPMGHRYTSGKISKGIVLRDGSALFGYTWEAQLDKVERIKGESDMIERSSVMISRDKGKTWQNGGDVIDDKLKDPTKKLAISGICEPALAELSDGRVYMLARTGIDRLYESRSTNGGKTWSRPVPSPLVGHNAPATLCRFRGNGPGLMVVWDNSPTQRWPLCVAASYDDAKTWTAPREIANTPGFECSYPGCTQTADKSLLVVWQQARPDGRREILCARFQPEWLTDLPAASQPSSRSEKPVR